MKHFLGLYIIAFLLLSCDEKESQEVNIAMLQPNENDIFYWKDSVSVQANIFNAINLSNYKIQLKGEHKDTAMEAFIVFNNTLQVGTINQSSDLSIKNTFSIPELILPGPYSVNFYVLTKNGIETSKTQPIYIYSLDDTKKPDININLPVPYQSFTTGAITCKALISDLKNDLSDGKINYIALWIKSLNNTDERYLINKWSHKNNFNGVYDTLNHQFNYSFNKPAKITHPGNFSIQLEARDQYFNTYLKETEIAFY